MRQALIASIGTADYREVEYTWQGRTTLTRFTPVALARLLNLRGARAALLVTEQARDKWFNTVREELEREAMTCTPILISETPDRNETHRLLESLDKFLKRDDEVIFDVTFSLRHLPFLYLSALVYLKAWKGVRLRGVFYGADKLPGTPIVEITHLVDLIDWHHALQSGIETGNYRKMAGMLRRTAGQLFLQEEGNPEWSRAANYADELARSLASGLPLEAGMDAARLREHLKGFQIPNNPFGRALQHLFPVLDDFALQAVEKPAAKLDPAELERELRIAEWYLDRGDIPRLVSLLREWLVNFAILRSGKDSDWLDYAGARKPAEDMLNALSQRAKHGFASPPERAVAGIWDEIAQARNRLQHGGFSGERAEVSPDKARNMLAKCRGLLGETDRALLRRRQGPRTLLSPFGLSAGTLYSALVRERPDHLVVITSPQAIDRLDEAIRRSGTTPGSIERVVLDDPHAGWESARAEAARSDILSLLASSAEVVVNLTGGTTLLQYVAQELGESARSLGARVRRIALVDRRTPEAQRENPWVLGEAVPLD